MSVKNFNGTIWNRTNDLPICGAAQPSLLPSINSRNPTDTDFVSKVDISVLYN